MHNFRFIEPEHRMTTIERKRELFHQISEHMEKYYGKTIYGDIDPAMNTDIDEWDIWIYKFNNINKK